MNLRSIKDGKLIYNLESNYKIRQILMNKVLPQEKYYLVPISNKYSVPVKLIFPPKMSKKTKYPMIVMVAGAPGNQFVHSRYF